MNDPTNRGAYIVDSSEFEIDLQLRSRPLLGSLVAMVLFYSAFTITFYIGIPIGIVYEAIGTSTRSEALVLQYNTYSSYVMALIEVLLGIYMDKFVPVLEVYLHNALFFLMRDSEGKPRSTGPRRLHAALLCLLPVMITLTNSSVKGLQAVPFITGVKRVMTVDDMKKDQPALEKLKAKLITRSRLTWRTNQRSVSDTILKNAVRQQVTPFTFDTDSSCGQRVNNTPDGSFISDWKLNAHELGTSSAIYGFIPREWNGEALTTEPIRTSTYTITYQQAAEALRTNTSLEVPPKKPSIKTAYEMLVQGKMVIERAYGNSVVGSYDCSRSDGRNTRLSPVKSSPSATTVSNGDEIELFKDNSTDQWLTSSNGSRQCEGGVSSMFKMGDYYNRGVFKPEDLIRDAAYIIGITIPFIAKEDTLITLDTYNLTDQIRLETMQIDLILNSSVNYGFQDASDTSSDPKYVYGSFQNTFCGSNNCAFLDTSGSFPIQPEIGVLPYYINCTLDQQRVHYSADYRTYFPDQCTRAANASFLYGYGSYITGKEFGSNGSTWNSSYIVAPRRRISFAFAKVIWTTQDLATTYNASCGRLYPNHTQKVNCTGLSYQLQPSGRFLFAGKSALPNNALRGTSFRSPIPLVQLNSPTVEVGGGKLATIERLAPENFNRTVWPRQAIYNGSALGGNKCSMLIDSYLNHVNENHFFLERPLQAMYTSFFYFLMENAAVTQLSDTAQVLRSATTAQTRTNDLLKNVRLKGDFQVRSIRLSMPLESYLTTLAGCVCIFVATVVIIFVPIRCVEFFPEGTTMAEQFMAMSFERNYPSSVHDKLIQLPAPASSVRFADVRIETLAIKHCPPGTNDSKTIQAKGKEDASESSESDSDVSQATISEEIA